MPGLFQRSARDSPCQPRYFIFCEGLIYEITTTFLDAKTGFHNIISLFSVIRRQLGPCRLGNLGICGAALCHGNSHFFVHTYAIQIYIQALPFLSEAS